MVSSTYAVPPRAGVWPPCVEHGPNRCRGLRRSADAGPSGCTRPGRRQPRSPPRWASHSSAWSGYSNSTPTVRRWSAGVWTACPIRELFDRRRRQDPGLSATAVALPAGLSGASHLLRELGLGPTSATEKNGVRYPPRMKSTIGVDSAAQIVRALGCAPRDFDGL